MAEYELPTREYALVFGTALVLTFLLTGVVRILATRVGAVTPIRDRDVHALPIPRMGGVAVYAGFNRQVPVRGVRPPRRLLPAPLNLIYRSLSTEAPKETFVLDTFEFLDRDAY